MRGLTLGDEEAENGEGYRRFGMPFSPDRVSERDDGDRASPTGDGSGALPFRVTRTLASLRSGYRQLTCGCKFDTIKQILHELIPSHLIFRMNRKRFLSHDHDIDHIRYTIRTTLQSTCNQTYIEAPRRP